MTKNEITESLRQVHTCFWETAAGLSKAELNTGLNGKWSVAQHLEHIQRAMFQVTRYLNLPKERIETLFGKAERQSLEAQELIRNYTRLLAAGAVATSQMTPEAGTNYEAEIQVEKGKTLTNELVEATDNWTEDELDGYYCPHPLLKKLTVREMLHFMIFHTEHHHHSIKQIINRLTQQNHA